ncbi:hypothetical protein GCM10025857_01070 [Alicyclobacillus contaminans]|uniref:L,D-transpeptidase n=1 Tax=Alicyclobacillus contaminans TaxID=392016 RepID=UPI000684DB87|nr:L,D-transpeptidase [Alicyclobacillus contaminans]GMA48750.1 hypothetical protein GCM10025857_01070 [Alicyclobacillus contaminans]
MDWKTLRVPATLTAVVACLATGINLWWMPAHSATPSADTAQATPLSSGAYDTSVYHAALVQGTSATTFDNWMQPGQLSMETQLLGLRPAKAPSLPPSQRIPYDTPVGRGFDWSAPTGGPYPDIRNDHNLWIDASLSQQRIRIMNGNRVIYTMITSSGLDGPNTYTPTGTYYIQNRGTWFYEPRFHEGAEYWVSWKGWGQYLFHTVPMDANHHILPTDAARLGVKDSHGCFHLTIADAKWIYDNIPTGTKVVIHL